MTNPKRLLARMSVVTALTFSSACKYDQGAEFSRFVTDLHDLALTAREAERPPWAVFDNLGEFLTQRDFVHQIRTTKGMVSLPETSIAFQTDDLVAQLNHSTVLDPSEIVVFAVSFDTSDPSGEHARGLWPAAAAKQVVDGIRTVLGEGTPLVVTLADVREYREFARAVNPNELEISDRGRNRALRTDSTELSMWFSSRIFAPLIASQNPGWIVGRYVSSTDALGVRYPPIVPPPSRSTDSSWTRMDVPEVHFTLDGAAFATHGAFSLSPDSNPDPVLAAMRATIDLIEELRADSTSTQDSPSQRRRMHVAVIQGICGLLLFVIFVGNFPTEKRVIQDRLYHVEWRAKREREDSGIRLEVAEKRQSSVERDEGSPIRRFLRRTEEGGGRFSSIATRIREWLDKRIENGVERATERRAYWDATLKRVGEKRVQVENEQKQALSVPQWSTLWATIMSHNSNDLLHGVRIFILTFMVAFVLILVYLLSDLGGWINDYLPVVRDVFLDSDTIPVGWERELPVSLAVVVTATMAAVTFCLYNVIPQNRRRLRAMVARGSRKSAVSGLVDVSIGVLVPSVLLALVAQQSTTGGRESYAFSVLAAAMMVMWTTAVWRGQLWVHAQETRILWARVQRERSGFWVRSYWQLRGSFRGKEEKASRDAPRRQVGPVTELFLASRATSLLGGVCYIVLLVSVADPTVNQSWMRVGETGWEVGRALGAGLMVATMVALLFPAWVLWVAFRGSYEPQDPRTSIRRNGGQ